MSEASRTAALERTAGVVPSRFLLDLGSGPSPRYGHQGVDLYPGPGVSWQCDLEQFPWVLRWANPTKSDGTPIGGLTKATDFDGSFYSKPRPIGEEPHLPDDYVDGITCNHLVEHVRDLPAFMAEMWRVCKDGAVVEISHPYQFNVRAWQDPTHVRALNEISWFYFDAKWRGNRPEFGPSDFELVELDAIPEENWKETAKEFPEEFERACRNQINVIADLRVTLRVRKT